jgi:hypothetical protein
MSISIFSKNSKFLKTLITLLVISLLTLFPMFALYMSTTGLKANKSLKSEMKAYKDSIKLPDFVTTSLTNDIKGYLNLTNDKVIVLSFLDLNCKECHSNLSEIKRIQSEFIKKTKRIRIVSILDNTDSLSIFNTFLKNEKIDTSSWDFYKINEKSELLKTFKLNEEASKSIVILIDRKGIVANLYNLKNREEINNLMRHATMLLPAKEDRRKIKFKRETELYN